MPKEKRDKIGVRLQTHPRNRRFHWRGRRAWLHLQQVKQQKSCMHEIPGQTVVFHEFTPQIVTTGGPYEPRLPGLRVVIAPHQTCHDSRVCMVTIELGVWLTSQLISPSWIQKGRRWGVRLWLFYHHFPSIPRSSKMTSSLVFPTKHLSISFPHTCVTCPVHIILLYSITLILFYEEHKSWKSAVCTFLLSVIIASLRTSFVVFVAVPNKL